MNKGLFDLTNIDSMKDDDIVSLNINESTSVEFDESKDSNDPEVKHEDHKKMSKEEKEKLAKNIKDNLEKNGKSHNESVITDILDVMFSEGTAEFDNKTPDVNHPEVSFETNGASGHNTPVPSTAAHKNYDETSVTIPEGNSETPKAKPYDNASVSIPSKVTLTSDVYNNALSALKKSFKESVEIIEMLENAEVVDEDIDYLQQEYIESVIDEQLLIAYENGPVFESVSRSDKSEVKSIVRKIRPKIEDEMDEKKITFYKSNILARFLSGIALKAGAFVADAALIANAGKFVKKGAKLAKKSGQLTAAALGLSAVDAAINGVDSAGEMSIVAAFKQVWHTRMWQVLGICITEEGNIKDIADDLTKKYADELGEYKVLYSKIKPTIVDMFRTKFGWKNVGKTYLLIVDKKIPQEVADLEKMKEPKEDKDNKSDKED